MARNVGGRCIGIRPIEPPWPLICAVAVEAAKTHSTMQPEENEFFPVHSVIGFKKLNPSGFKSIAGAALER